MYLHGLSGIKACRFKTNKKALLITKYLFLVSKAAGGFIVMVTLLTGTAFLGENLLKCKNIQKKGLKLILNSILFFLSAFVLY